MASPPSPGHVQVSASQTPLGDNECMFWHLCGSVLSPVCLPGSYNPGGRPWWCVGHSTVLGGITVALPRSIMKLGCSSWCG